MKYKYFLLANFGGLLSPHFNPKGSSAIFSIGCHQKKKIDNKTLLNRLEFLLGTKIAYKNLKGLIGIEINASFLGTGIQMFFSNKTYHFEGKVSFKLNQYIALSISQRFSEKYSTSVGLILNCYPLDYISINSNISIPFEWKNNIKDALNKHLDSNPQSFEAIQKRIAENSETFQKNLFYHFLLYFEKKEENEESKMSYEKASEFFSAYWENLSLIAKPQAKNEFLKSFEDFAKRICSLLENSDYLWGEEYVKFLVESNFENEFKDNLDQKVIFHNIIGHTDVSFLKTLTQYTRGDVYIFNIVADNQKESFRKIYSKYLGKIIFPVFLPEESDDDEDDEDEVGHVITKMIENHVSEEFDPFKRGIQSGPNCAIYSYYAIILTTLLQSSLKKSYKIIKNLNDHFATCPDTVCSLLKEILNSNKMDSDKKKELIKRLKKIPSYEGTEPNWEFGKALRGTLVEFLPCLRAASDQENAEKLCSIIEPSLIGDFTMADIDSTDNSGDMDNIKEALNIIRSMIREKNNTANLWRKLIKLLKEKRLEEVFFRDIINTS